GGSAEIATRRVVDRREKPDYPGSAAPGSVHGGAIPARLGAASVMRRIDREGVLEAAGRWVSLPRGRRGDRREPPGDPLRQERRRAHRLSGGGHGTDRPRLCSR